MFKATSDPKRPTIAPKTEDSPPHLNFAPYENALAKLTEAAGRYRAAAAAGSPNSETSQTLGPVNAKLRNAERRLLDDAGLPGRSWYRHLLYAPGVYSGYDVKTVPAVREAIEGKRWSEADAEIVRVSRALDSMASLVREAAEGLGSARAGR